MNEKKCAICGDPANDEIRSHFSLRDVCNEHKEYSAVGYPELLKIKKGELDKLPENLSRCLICDCRLSERDEKILVNNYSTIQNIVCEKHGEVRDWYQQDLAKLWFEFKKEFPEAHYPTGLLDPEKWREKFYNWRKQNGHP